MLFIVIRDSIVEFMDLERTHSMHLQGFKKIIVLFLFYFVGSISLFAGVNDTKGSNGGQPGSFLTMGVGVRALSMGGAYSAVAGDVSSSYWNPAQLGYLRFAQAEFSSMDMLLDRRLTTMTGAMPLGRLFTVGMSWQGFSVNDIEARVGDSVEPDSRFGARQNAFVLSFGSAFSQAFAIGGSVKYLTHDFSDATARGVGLDLGLSVGLTDWFRLGFVGQNLTAGYSWNSGIHETIPATGRIGGALELKGLTLTSDFIMTAQRSNKLAIGMELRLLSAFPVRLGLNGNQLFAGFGFNSSIGNQIIQIDYGFTNNEIVQSNVNQVSVTISFGTPAQFEYSSRSQLIPSAFGRKRLVVTAEKLNMRVGPGIYHRKVGSLARGQRLFLLKASGVWRMVKMNDGLTGWVHGKYVEIAK